MITLLNTTNEPDALELGFRAPIAPQDGGLRMELEPHPTIGPIVTMWGPDGQVELVGKAAIQAAMSRLGRALAMSERAVA